MPLDLTPKQPPYYQIDSTQPQPNALQGQIYMARLSQTGTNAPSAILNTNNDITGITFTREGAGAYSIIAPADTLTTNKTFWWIGPNNSPFVSYIRCVYNGEEQMTLESYTAGGVAADDLIVDMTITILVTP